MLGFKAILCATFVAALLFLSTNAASVPGDGDAGPIPGLPSGQQPPETGSGSVSGEPPAAPLPTQPEPEAVSVNQTKPKLNDYQESSNKIAINNQHPESRVTITVGEENGFQYTVNGHTYSRERIAVSGEYFNDEVHAYGYARLFLVAEPAIGYYAVRPTGNRLDVYVQNYYYEEFYYEIYTPYPVSGYDLRHGQINSTAILITGPSRSVVEGRRRTSRHSSLKTSKKP